MDHSVLCVTYDTRTVQCITTRQTAEMTGKYLVFIYHESIMCINCLTCIQAVSYTVTYHFTLSLVM